MKKTLYSLTLSEDVVRAVDAMAHQMGMSRSGLVNQILADYVSVTTPERHINQVFQAIQALVAPGRELVPFFTPNSATMSLKSSLMYKYRPTVKYEVELTPEGEKLGELTVIFRTQSESLLSATYLAPELGVRLECALYDGKFVRPIAMPRRTVSPEELAEAISGYVQLFDRLLKGRLSGEYGASDVEREYRQDLARRAVLI